MARTGGTISVGADTRQLERDIQSALSKDFKFKGLNERAFTQPLGRITGAANEFQKSLDASNARVIAFGASAGLIYTVEKAFTDLIKSTVEVQKSLTDINVILNTTSEGLAKFGGTLFDIAKNTGQSFQTVAAAATELARQGLGVEETLKRASDALILTRLSGLDANSAVEALTATINSFNKTALDSTTIINKLANVDAAFAVSSADLANALQRVGSSAQDVGVGFDELLAIVTSVQQTTARGGAVIGNSLKTIFTRVQRTDVLDQLQALGLNVRDLEGNTLPAISILRELAGTFDNLSDAQRSQIAELVGGVFQINILKAALGDLGKEYSIYDRALKTSATATDEAIKRNQALNQTLSALFNATVQNVTQLGATIGAGAFQPAIEGTLKNVNKLLEAINNQDSEGIGAKLGGGILKGLSTFISGPGIVLITAVIGKLALDLSKFATSGVKALLGLNEQTAARAQLQSKVNEVLLREPEILAAINAKQISVLDVENRILGILRQQNALRVQAANLSSSITSGLTARGVGVSKGQITTKSEGFIPNFVMSEVYGALSGGYVPGDIKQMNIPGQGQIIYNTAETVKKFPGMGQPAIMPPSKSKAGKEYRKNFIAQNNFDPYASQGFIPNFNLAAIRSELPMNSIREQMMFRRYLRQGYEVLGGELYERANLASNAPLYNDKTLVRAGGQILVKSNKKSTIVKQLREKELATAQGKGAKETAKVRSKLVYVYPDAAGGASPFFVGGTSKTGESYKFPAFPFPGGGEKIPDELYNNISNSLVQNAKDYISQVSTRPQLVDQKIFEQYVKSNLSRSAVEAATGQVFEASVKAAIKRVTTSEISNFDLDKGELLAISKRFKSAGPLKDFTAGDFKNSLSDSNLDSFADKIATKEGKTKARKTKSAGFIPNFAALGSSIKRELAAGIPASKIRVGQDNRLMSPKNPLGIGVYNTEDEPNGIKQGIAAQKNINAARKAGSFSEGFVPNFALQSIKNIGAGAGGMPLVEIIPATKEAEGAVRQLIKSVLNGSTSLDKANAELIKLSNEFRLINTTGGTVGNALKRAATINQKLNTETDALVKQAGSLFRGRQALITLEKRAAQGGVGGEMARSGLERATSAREATKARLQTAGIGLSIAAPIAAQTVAEFMPGNRTAAGAAEGIGTFASFAGMGALFGPPGVAIGALVGSAVGLKKAFDIINDQTEKYAKNAQKAADSLNRFNEDVQKFLTSRTQVEGLRSGEIRGTTAELGRADYESKVALARIFQSAGPEITAQITSALQSGNEEQLKEALGRAAIAKEAANSIAQLTSEIVRLKKESGGKIPIEDLRKSLESFGNLKVRSGKVFGELLTSEQILAPINAFSTDVRRRSPGQRLAVQNTGPTAQQIQERIQQFKKLSDELNTETPIGGLAKDIAGLLPFERRNRENRLPVGITQNELANFTYLPQNKQAEIVKQSFREEDAASVLQTFTGNFDQFVTKLVSSGELFQSEGENVKLIIEGIARGAGTNQEKIKLIKESLAGFGKALEASGVALENTSKRLFNFAELSANLLQIFAENPVEEKQNQALERLRTANFSDLFKDISFKDTQINSVLNKTVQDTLNKIATGTPDEAKRLEEAKKFQEEFNRQLEAMVKAGKPYEIALAEITAAADRAATSASISSLNLNELSKNISDASLRENTLNQYRKIELELRKEFGDDTQGLARAAESAKIKLQALADSVQGKAFRQDLNARLSEAARLDILNNRFTGLDLNEMGKFGKADYQDIVRATGAQTITAINEGIFDPATKQKLIDQAILEQERMMAKIDEGTVTTQDISKYKTRNQTIQNSASILQNSFNKLNETIYTTTAREEASSAIQTQLRRLEEEYKGNLEALNRVAPLLADKLLAIAGVREGSVFADEYKTISEAERTQRIREKQFKATDPFAAFSDEMLYSSQDMARDVNATFVDTAKTMKSEFNNAFQSVIDGTQTVSDAFRNMALNISRRIQQLALDMATNAIFNSLFSSVGGLPSLFKNPLGGATGGMIVGNTIQRFSGGGRVMGGSGIKDDVPAMLSKGEYVIKKSAVNKYGEPFLRKLNEGGFIQMAGGGFASYNPSDAEIDRMMANGEVQPIYEDGKEIEGRIVTKDMARQFQETINDLIGGKDISFSEQNSVLESFSNLFGGGLRSELGNVYTYNDPLYPTGGTNVLDPRLSDLARMDPNNPQTKIIEDKRNRLIDYLAEGIGIYYDNRNNAIETIRANLENRARVDEINKQNQDNYNKQMNSIFWGGLLSAGMAVGGGLLSQFIGGLGGIGGMGGPRSGGTAGLNTGSSGRLPVPSSSAPSNLAAPSARLNVPSTTQVSNLNPYVGTSARLTYTPPPPTMSQYNNAKVYGGGLGQIGGGGSYPYAIFNRAKGGPIGFAKGGSAGKDDVPAMLMGGEYVIRKDSVDLYGKEFFDSVNSGKIRKFAEGGFVQDNNTLSPNGRFNTETTQNGDISNNISISINIDQNGAVSESFTMNNRAEGETPNTNKLETEKQAKDLSDKIKTEVIKIITEQQRPGGMLSSSVYKKNR